MANTLSYSYPAYIIEQGNVNGLIIEIFDKITIVMFHMT